MGSYASAYLSDGRSICSFRNGVDSLFFGLFTRDDWIELLGAEALELTARNYPDNEVEDAKVQGFRLGASALRDRLDVMGVDLGVVAAELEQLVNEEIERVERRAVITGDDEYRSWSQENLSALRDLTWDTWLAALQVRISSGDPLSGRHGRMQVGSAGWLMSFWDYHDPRYALRAVLEAVSSEETITLDLDDQIEEGYVDPSVDPRSIAAGFISYARQGLPPIVLTEGSFDTEVIHSALRVRRPHLVDYIKLPDFSHRPEGGTAALRQTVRAFASAGVPNRVVALFDNDAAARDVVRTIDTEALPSNMRIVLLPDLPVARAYPTLGPQGEVSMDVNGLAASIELFLGEDVLEGERGLRPVEWRGYLRGVGAYQGEVSGKSEIHEAFRRKVAAAIDDPAVVDGQDWSGIDLLLDAVLGAVRPSV